MMLATLQSGLISAAIAAIIMAVFAVIVIWQIQEGSLAQRLLGFFKGIGYLLLFVSLLAITVGSLIWGLLSLPDAAPVVIPAWAFVAFPAFVCWICSVASKCNRSASV